MRITLTHITVFSLLVLTACSASGVRTHEALRSALEAKHIEGLNKDSEKIASPLFEPMGYAIRVHKDEIQTYAYGNTAKAEEAMKKIQKDGTPTDQPGWKWEDSPHFFRNGNFIAIYLGNDANVTTALEEILGKQIAGAPLPVATQSSSSSSVSSTSGSGANVKAGTGAVMPKATPTKVQLSF